MTSGAQMLSPDPDTELRVARFKSPSTSTYDTYDMSMARWAAVLKHDLAEVKCRLC